MFESQGDLVDWGEPGAELDEPELSDADYDRMVAELIAADPLHRPEPTVDEVLAWAQTEPPSAAVWAQLQAIDPTGLDEDQGISYSVGWERVANSAHGYRALGVAATVAASPRCATVPREMHAAHQLGPALGFGRGAGDRLVADAVAVATGLPATKAMLLAGNISWRKASSVAAGTACLSADNARKVEDKVLPGSWGRSPWKHDQVLARTVEQVDPQAADDNRKDRARDIRLVTHHYGAGMGQLFADMPSEWLDTIRTAADSYARSRKAAGDPRSLDQLRVVYLVHASRSYLSHGDPTTCLLDCDALPDPDPGDGAVGEPETDSVFGAVPTRHGKPVALHLVWDLSSLLGLTSHCGLLTDSHTSLPPTAVRELIAGGLRVRRMLINPDGHCVDLTPRSWLLPPTDGSTHRGPVVLSLTTPTVGDDLAAEVRAAIDALEDRRLAAVLRELLDYPVTAESLDQHDSADPTPALAEYTAVRAGHPVNPCAGPTAASAGDNDHHQARKDGGKTERANLGPLTRRWHRIKTFTTWTVRQIVHGWEWTSPTGRIYLIEPFDYRLGP
jgi:hypothetical protein